MRFALVVAAFVALSLIACSAPQGSASGTGQDNTLVQTPDYTGVIFSTSRAQEFRFLFGKDSTEFWEPSVDDITRAEECIRQFLVSVLQDPHAYQKEQAAFIVENLNDFRRQYVGIVVDGEKRIWTNAFFSEDSFPNWMRDPVYVLDGGNHFWEIVYVLSTDECVAFNIHGEA